MHDFKIELGAKVKDKITGCEGIVVGRSQWFSGCNTYQVRPIELKDGVRQDNIGLDEPEIEVIGHLDAKPNRATGGPERKVARSH